MCASWPVHAQDGGAASAGTSPYYRRAVKVNFSWNSELEKKRSVAIVLETRRRNFHEVEINSVSYSKTVNNGLTTTSTGASIRYQFARHVAKNARFIPQAGLSLQLSGSGSLTTNPNPVGYTKVREYLWVIKPGLSFPCRYNFSRRFFIETNMIVNLIMIDGSRLKYYRLDGHQDVYGGWRKFAPFMNDRIYVKLGVGFRF